MPQCVDGHMDLTAALVFIAVVACLWTAFAARSKRAAIEHYGTGLRLATLRNLNPERRFATIASKQPVSNRALLLVLPAPSLSSIFERSSADRYLPRGSLRSVGLLLDRPQSSTTRPC